MRSVPVECLRMGMGSASRHGQGSSWGAPRVCPQATSLLTSTGTTVPAYHSHSDVNVNIRLQKDPHELATAGGCRRQLAGCCARCLVI